jgi:OmpA-OmpF porin, OOP family
MIRIVFQIIVGTALLVLISSPALAEGDVEGSGDHPLLPRVAGSWIFTFERSDFDRLTIPTGPASSDGFESTESMDGEILSFTYRFEDEDTSTLRILHNYRQILDEAGFEILFSGEDAELGYRGGVGLLIQGDFNRPDRRCCSARSRGHDIRYLAARSADGQHLMSMATFNASLGMGPVALVDIVSAEDMEMAAEHHPLSADDMADGLTQAGRVAIQNIQFEFDSDRILPESSEAIETIAELMQVQPALALLVVGHTDAVGDFDYNLRLSMARAQAVVDTLVERHGIQRSRLQAAGAGMMAPIASNRSESGRAENRRVELVEVPD